MSDNETLFEEDTATAAPAFPGSSVMIHAISPEGYPITITLNDPAQGAMTNWIKMLQGKGFTPPTNPMTAASLAASSSTGATPTCQNRNCSNFGKEMAPSTQPSGGWYCKGKDTITGNQKGYCKATAK